jgi:diguanylate cyclase (GGDEF)-like protein
MKSTYKMADFNPEVSRLRRQVTRLIEDARHNEQVHNRFQGIELSLLSAQDFNAIADYLQGKFRLVAAVDEVSLVLLDAQNEIKNVMCSSESQDCPPGMMLVNDPVASYFLRRIGKTPLLSHYQVGEHEWLFKDLSAEEGSLAILPFVRRGQTIGCLALFSKKLERYKPDAATEFLQRLGAITAICVENCLNYEHLRRLGLTDALTGLANRRELEKRMGIEVSRSLRESTPLSCLYLDVDHFKQVNDVYGHDVGDHVLQKVAAIMIEAVRLGDVVARYGGEEFVIVLPGISGSIALETAERIRRAVENSNIEMPGKKRLEITISIGMASFAAEKNSIGDTAEISDEIIARADRALMQAKEQGRNRVLVAD